MRKFIPILILTLFSYILLVTLFFINPFTKPLAILPTLIPTIACIITLAILILFIWHHLAHWISQKYHHKNFKPIFIAIYFLAIITAQIIHCANTDIVSCEGDAYRFNGTAIEVKSDDADADPEGCGWEPQVIARSNAQYGLDPEEDTLLKESYYHKHPHLTYLSGISRGAYHISQFFGLENARWIEFLINILATDLSLIFIYLITKKLFDTPKALFALLISGFTLPLILFYIPLFYSDVLSMPFILATAYLCLLLRASKSWSKTIALIFLISICTFIGTQIKFTALIILIAFLIDAILHRDHKIDLKKSLISYLAITLIISTGWAINSSILNKTIHSNLSPSAPVSFTPLHYIMLGLHKPYGAYTNDDYATTYLAKNEADARNKQLDTITSRLSDMGIIGYTGFLFNKIAYAWGDPTYQVNYFVYKYSTTTQKLALNPYESASNNSGAFILASYMRTIYLIFIVAIIYGAHQTIKHKKYTTLTPFRLSILGLTTFLLIWENSPRYVFNYTPIIIILAAPILYDALPKWCNSLKAAYTKTIHQKLNKHLRNLTKKPTPPILPLTKPKQPTKLKTSNKD
jgi:hypothetical protein